MVRPRITDAMPVMEATEAIAWVEGAPIATSDPAMLRVAKALNVASVPLPDQWGNVLATERWVGARLAPRMAGAATARADQARSARCTPSSAIWRTVSASRGCQLRFPQ